MPIESFAELHDLNTRAGRYVRRNPLTGDELSSDSIEHFLKRVQRHGRSNAARKWATRSLAASDQIRSTTQAIFTGGTRAGARRLAAVTVLKRAGRTAVARSLGRIARAAGPIGGAIAVAIDVQEVYSQVAAYRRGEINRREMTIALARSGGGVFGAASGAATGASLGALGGPLLWITVPAGATIGGIVGYFAGSAASGAVADAWYVEIDEDVKNGTDAWLVSTCYPLLRATP